MDSRSYWAGTGSDFGVMETFAPVPAKLLLFGEHSVLLGSPAVTLPLWDFSARLKFPGKVDDPAQETSNLQLQKFLQYIRDNRKCFDEYIDINRFTDALRAGLYLESNIPQGYGLGSSASVCVAVYKAFNKALISNTAELKDFYSKLESFFHGKSSGIDPLAIHADRIVIADQNSVLFSEKRKFLLENQAKAYLLDSKKARNASVMIKTFQTAYESDDFKERFHTQYLPLLEKIKLRIISNEAIEWNSLHEISQLQVEFFRRLIPSDILLLWKELLQTNKVCLKLLGAGGGGFFLAFTREESLTIKDFDLTPIGL